MVEVDKQCFGDGRRGLPRVRLAVLRVIRTRLARRAGIICCARSLCPPTTVDAMATYYSNDLEWLLIRVCCAASTLFRKF